MPGSEPTQPHIESETLQAELRKADARDANWSPDPEELALAKLEAERDELSAQGMTEEAELKQEQIDNLNGQLDRRHE